jgi:phage-related protein
MTINMTAKMTGMKPEEVAAIIADGVPKAMEAAKLDPDKATAAFKASFEALPEPLQKMYEKMGAAAAAQGASVDDFRTMFGAQATALAETASSMAGATTEQAGAVFGAAVPAMKDAMRTGAEAAGAAADSIDASKAQEMLGQAAQATANVFGKLAGR